MTMMTLDSQMIIIIWTMSEYSYLHFMSLHEKRIGCMSYHKMTHKPHFHLEVFCYYLHAEYRIQYIFSC